MVLTLRRREDDRILREPKRMQLLANSDEGEEPPEAAKMKGVALPTVIHHRVAAVAPQISVKAGPPWRRQ